MNTITRHSTLLISLILFGIHLPKVFATSNIDNTHKYAWSESTGWFNFHPTHSGVMVYRDHLEGYAWSGNIGWIKLGSYSGGDAHTYDNTDNTNWGVNHDSSGKLSGYAWGENIGWINFNPSHSQVTINPETGDFEGYAYSGNVGWIHFQNASPAYKVSYLAAPLPKPTSELTDSSATSSDTTPTVPVADTTSTTAPIAPTDLKTAFASLDHLILTWIDNSTDETGFLIERNSTLIHTTAANETTYHDTNLTCDTTYTYAIKATNSMGDSSVLTTEVTTPGCSSTHPTPVLNEFSATMNYAANMEGKTITGDITVVKIGSVSNAVFAGRVENQGLISNSTVTPDATIEGGTLTGIMINQGTIANVDFVGEKLSGGTLVGFITNNSQVGGVIENVQLGANTTISGGTLAGHIDSTAPDTLIRDVQLADNVIIIGGTLGGEIKGDPSNLAQISAAQIAPGTQLSYVHLSPTVQLSNEVVLGPGVKTPADPDHPTLMDFGIDPSQISQWDETRLQQLELKIFSTLTAEQVKQILPTLFTAIGAEQLTEFTKEGVSGITTKQFDYLPVESLSGLTANNMGGLTPDVLHEMTSNHLDAINAEEFQQMPSTDISKFLVNLETEQVSFAGVERLIPPNWKLDLKSGALVAPDGSKLTLRALQHPEDWPSEIVLPDIIDLKKGFGVGGAGTPLLEELAASLVESNLENLVLSQDDTGILRVELTDDSDNLYTFIPDFDHISQVADEEISVGLSVDEGGFYSVTTPNGLQIRVIPALQDPKDLLSMFDVEIVMVGERGEVLLEWSPQTTRARRRHRVVGIPRANIYKRRWRSRSNKSYRRQEDANLETFENPGIYIVDNEVGQGKYIKVVYSNGMIQDFNPTVLSPDTFIEEGVKFRGVKSVFFNTDGTFCSLYENKPYLLTPSFEVQTQNSLGNLAEVDVTVGRDGNMQYAIELPTTIQKENSATHQQLLFDIFVENAVATNKCK